jgi:hypothetical protein
MPEVTGNGARGTYGSIGGRQSRIPLNGAHAPTRDYVTVRGAPAMTRDEFLRLAHRD